MKVEAGQIWADISTGTKIEILKATLGSKVVEVREVEKPDVIGSIRYADLYTYFTFVHWKK